jgi:lysophospholipase L1-like esterase
MIEPSADPAAATANAARGLIVATLGDSITAGTPGWDPNPAVREAEAATDPQSQYQYWAALKHPDLEITNHGINRQRTDEIAARLEAAAQGARVIVLQGGINDIVQGRAIEDAASDMDSMVAAALAFGLRVLIAELLPWNNGWPDGDPKIVALNGLYRDGAESRGVSVLPFYATLEDPSRPGRMREEWTSDGTHPSVEGYRRLGEVAFALPADTSYRYTGRPRVLPSRS